MSDSSDLANTLHDALVAGVDFDIAVPDFSGDLFQVPDGTGDLYQEIPKVNPDDLTVGDGSPTGDGMFDRLMRAFKSHLRQEFDLNRISGSQYAEAYIALTQSAMSNATQFLLGREQSHWQAVGAQIQARIAEIQSVTAKVELEAAKMRLEVLRLEALTQQVTFALNKIRLANEDLTYETGIYNLENILPKNALILDKQVAQAEAQTNLTLKQIEQIQTEIDLFPVKEDLLEEQVEAQRAQTLDTRTDGVTPIAGNMGKQKDLYSQQITSYQRDAEVKAAKIFSEAWITMKTLDEGLAPPNGYANANLDDILDTIKLNNNLSVVP